MEYIKLIHVLPAGSAAYYKLMRENMFARIEMEMNIRTLQAEIQQQVQGYLLEE